MTEPALLRHRIWLVAGASAMVFAWLLGLVSATWPAQGSGSVMFGHLWPYWAGVGISWAALTWAAVRLLRRPNSREDAGSFGHAALIILLVALLVRVLIVATTSPVLSDDIWRYILDGRTLAGGDNPYRLSPSDRAAQVPAQLDQAVSHARTVELVERINHPHLVTIYQPLSQWTFALLYRTGRVASNPFRLGFSLLDVAVVGLLLLALHRAGASPWWAALYAWHPLAISETAGSGHQDVLGILPLLGTILLTQRLGADARPTPPDSSDGNRIGVAAAIGALLAMAVAVKPIVAPLTLPIARCLVSGRPGRKAAASLLAALLAAAVVLAVLYLPFVWMEGGVDGMVETGRTFVDAWAFNGSIHAALSAAVADGFIVDAICGGLLLAVLLGAMALRLDIVEIAITYLFAALLLSSTVHPWYLLWALVLVPLRPRFALTPAVWVWSLTITWSYAAHVQLGYRLPPWVGVVEYVPVYVALAAGLWSASRRRNRLPPDP